MEHQNLASGRQQQYSPLPPRAIPVRAYRNQRQVPFVFPLFFYRRNVERKTIKPHFFVRWEEPRRQFSIPLEHQHTQCCGEEWRPAATLKKDARRLWRNWSIELRWTFASLGFCGTEALGRWQIVKSLRIKAVIASPGHVSYCRRVHVTSQDNSPVHSVDLHTLPGSVQFRVPSCHETADTLSTVAMYI